MDRPTYLKIFSTGPQCYISGIWTQCISVDLFASDTYDDCLKKCVDLGEACTHFTHSPPTALGYRANPLLAGVAICELFLGPCDGPIQDPDCATCMSGESSCTALGELECSKDACIHGTVLKSLRDTDFRACLNLCNSNSSCAWFSHYNSTNACQLLVNQDSLTDDGKGKCTSGQRGCADLGEPQCGILVLCDGTILSEAITGTAEACLSRCQKELTCKWFSFHKTDNRCTLFDSCPDPFPSDGNYISGERRCTSLGTYKA